MTRSDKLILAAILLGAIVAFGLILALATG